MFHEKTAQFQDDVLKLGHYFLLSIDVGPVITAKILTQNEQVLHRLTYRPLTSDEIADKDGSYV